MAKVLIVDDDVALLDGVAGELAQHAPELTVLTASQGDTALQIIDSEDVDVLVTDLEVPEVNGVDLLARVRRTNPGVAFLALSGGSSQKGMASGLAVLGVGRVLPRTVVPQALAERIRHAVAGAARGYVRGFSLPTFLQLIQLERKTCTLEVHSNGSAGYLFFRDGDLLDAETDGKSGTEAASAILCWPVSDIQIHRYCTRTERRIAERTEEILLRSWTEWDARNGAGNGGAPASEQAPVFAPAEDSMNRLENVLAEFREQVPEFVSTDLVSVESGLSIGGSSADPAFDASAASASFGEVVRANMRALELLGMDAQSAEDILITTARVNILLRMLGRSYYHCLAIGNKGSLGFARAVMRKYEPTLLSALGEVDSQA